MKAFRPLPVLLCSGIVAGCVDIRQEIHVKHDGSGKIVERISLTQRGARMLEGLKKRSDVASEAPALLSRRGFEERAKAMGEVVIESQNETKLADGRVQIETVYTFKDINTIRLFIVPTLNYKAAMQKERRCAFDGTLRLKYNPNAYESWGRIYRETLNVECATTHELPPQPLVSPSEREKYQRVLPAFVDMLSDFRLSIVLVAPIEAFEEKDMLWSLPVDGNRVRLFEMTGEGVANAPGMILQLMMNEVIGGEDLARHQDAMPGVFTPWPAVHGGRGMRFMKSEHVKK